VERRVAVITGDGDVDGAGLARHNRRQAAEHLASSARQRHYSASAVQPSATEGVSICRGSARVTPCRTVSDLSRADELRELLHSGQGPIFIHARVDADDQKRVIPSRDGVAIKHRFMQALGVPV
jgi:hypothetical protein